MRTPATYVRRLAGVLLALMLTTAVLACHGNAVRPATVELGAYAQVLDQLYTRLGAYEVLFCLGATRQDDGAYEVTSVWLPWQTGNDSTSVPMYDCSGYPGTAHNHPLLGGVWAHRPVCWASKADLRALAARPDRYFMVIWCAPGRFVTFTKETVR